MRFAKVLFSIAGIWGLLVVTPLYVLFGSVGNSYPPPITHPEFYYGFIAITLAWQIAFLVIATDPRRLRLMMLPAIIEKLGYVTTLVALWSQHRMQLGQLSVALPDLVLGILFLLAFLLTAEAPENRLADTFAGAGNRQP
jgi:hypothetical protein